MKQIQVDVKSAQYRTNDDACDTQEYALRGVATSIHAFSQQFYLPVHQ